MGNSLNFDFVQQLCIDKELFQGSEVANSKLLLEEFCSFSEFTRTRLESRRLRILPEKHSQGILTWERSNENRIVSSRLCIIANSRVHSVNLVIANR